MSINDIFPVELLLEVFSNAVHDPSFTRHCMDAVHPPLRLMLAITHVCSLWRGLGLKTSTLWTGCVDMARPIECTKEILLRAAVLPLHFTFFVPDQTLRNLLFSSNRPPETFRETTSRLRNNPYRELILSRTRSLDATLPPIEHDNAFDLLKRHLPQMETISLQSFWSSVLKTNGLFNDETWMVRILNLRNCGLRLQPKFLPFLEELRIVNPHVCSTPRLDEWVALLSGLPQLRVFELIDCVGPFSLPSPAWDKKVNMVNLEKFVLKTSEKFTSISILLLGALVIPPSCALSIATPITPFSPFSDDLFAILAKRDDTSDDSLGDHLHLVVDDKKFSLSAVRQWSGAETFIEFYFGGSCMHLNTGYGTDWVTSDAKLVLQMVLEAFRKPFSTIRRLTHRTYMRPDSQLNPFFHLHLLAAFPRVEFIELNVESILADSPDPPANRTASFRPDKSDPRLSWFLTTAEPELAISRVHFRGESLHNLCLSLLYHFQSGGNYQKDDLKIRKLSFTECTGLKSWELAKLEELVGMQYGVKITYRGCEVLDEY
ncbi:hypothetical protein M413DRAFT_261678 [Hebeloma cylindrosporum]|uniref:F-box domain-containing protein n=1 Tax=Hebeloma cylindrosporum TaxID=76867 RepID=A0A0C3CD86_HEBCY|nr:hypothetical protein M413DRAFT_261678 [Hebeloma cylindrosporum h7]